MDGLGGGYAKERKSHKDKYCTISHGKSKKIQQTTEYSEKRSSLTDTENKLVVTSGGGGGAIQGWGILMQTSVCKIGYRSRCSVITVNGRRPLQIV